MKHTAVTGGGVLLAVLAALSFGVTTPVVERAGRGAGPLATAALLYAGAGAAGLLLARWLPLPGAPMTAASRRRLLLVALCGAAIAPALLAWGLQRAGATTGSLLLNLEAVFTALLAWRIHREPIGRRVAAALGLMVLGGVALLFDAARAPGGSLAGVLAVCGATLAWAMDNTLSRDLAEHDPARVTAGKGLLGAGLTGGLALASGEAWPGAGGALALLACGATGYGLSLRLYLLAQRRIGAARTGSVFALAPFAGALVALGLGDRAAGPGALVAGALFVAGVALHLTERHAHRHRHLPIEHEHLHRHDDGHHEHDHQPPFAGQHAHPHRHDPIEHEHDHAPDLHHGHEHEPDPAPGH